MHAQARYLVVREYGNLKIDFSGEVAEEDEHGFMISGRSNGAASFPVFLQGREHVEEERKGQQCVRREEGLGKCLRQLFIESLHALVLPLLVVGEDLAELILRSSDTRLGQRCRHAVAFVSGILFPNMETQVNDETQLHQEEVSYRNATGCMKKGITMLICSLTGSGSNSFSLCMRVNLLRSCMDTSVSTVLKWHARNMKKPYLHA